MEQAERFVRDLVLPQLIGKDINELWEIINPMGLLTAVLAMIGKGSPEPRLVTYTKNFVTTFYIKQIIMDCCVILM